MCLVSYWHSASLSPPSFVMMNNQRITPLCVNNQANCQTGWIRHQQPDVQFTKMVASVCICLKCGFLENQHSERYRFKAGASTYSLPDFE